MNCAYHGQNSAVVQCNGCGKPLCPGCDHRIKGFPYCQDCIVQGVDLLRQQNRSSYAPFIKKRTSPFVAALLIALAVRWLAWTRTGYAIDGDRLLLRTGWWRRRITILPASKIQSADLRESFVSRLFGVASLQFGVAGGGLAGHSIPAIPRGEARKLRASLLGFAS